MSDKPIKKPKSSSKNNFSECESIAVKIDNKKPIKKKLRKGRLPEDIAGKSSVKVKEKKEAFIPPEQCKTRSQKKGTFPHFFKKNPGGDQTGFMSKKGEESRPPRPYKNDRIAQILKHVASQLFGVVYDDEGSVTSPVEIQILYLVVGGKAKLVIAENQCECAQELNHILQRDKFKDILTSSYEGNSSHFTDRSERFSSKLRDRVLNENFKAWPNEVRNKEDIIDLIDLLSSGSIFEEVDLNAKPDAKEMLLGNGSMFIITSGGGPEGRHAEERLIDLYKLLSEEDIRAAYIYGKKRPCMSCSGSLSKVKGLMFSPHPGHAWMGRVADQPTDVFVCVCDIASNTKSFVSVNQLGKKIKDFASDSDSDTCSDSSDSSSCYFSSDEENSSESEISDDYDSSDSETLSEFDSKCSMKSPR